MIEGASAQMHIHVAKLRPDVRKALVTSAWGKTSFTTFIDIPNPVSVGHVMRAVFIEVRVANVPSDCVPNLQYLLARPCRLE